MKKISALLCIALAVASCGGRRKALLPNVSGKAGEIVVVMEKEDWEGNPGIATRELLAADCPFLPQREPLYTLINITPGGFASLLKVHRNIVFFDIDPMVASTGVRYLQDKWAAPQCVVAVSAPDAATAVDLLRENGKTIVSAIEQAERNRVISNTIRYEDRSIAPQVREIFGGSPHFPTGYKLKKKTQDFVWIADEKQYTTQGIFVYRYPVSGGDEFSTGRIIAERNRTLMENVPGMFENSYMITGKIPAPTVEYLRYQGRDFAQTRGWWEVENDFMGGPFVSHSFYSPDGKYIVVAEAFVYAPKYDKRQYLRQVESLLYSWEWEKK